MGISSFMVKNGTGKYTTLDRAYKKLIDEIMLTFDEDKRERWEVYNLIITELVKSNKEKYFQEIKYRLTDGENPNSVILDIINRDDEPSGLLWLLKKRIENYLEDDSYKRFYE